ncbi:Protein of unknown function [Daejeonella rubra]|uniref:GmrSD restriction endonucleases N-terminal domain-containing protein n=1 Tax=Daejeonella rubra TaxID=990371 RepID=A0A1G9YCD1_9SPHI|nr:DUF262 domain-containing protein [Daejeonella rubra]SDN06296.1 Protein of unknown function [Daejeonella rubra]
MTELIFSINDIFNDESQEGCLTQYGCKSYHIPAYQRGYKWSSQPNGAVSILLKDLWNAFESIKENQRKEFYLQYITVKKCKLKIEDKEDNFLEVIDGQQRLTTLSIIISVLSMQLEENNFSDGKLHYAIRQNFFSENIYEKEDLQNLVEKKWHELSTNPDYNKQDIYYLHSATCNANEFFKEKNSELRGFFEYLKNYVKLIVNSVEPHVESETVFKNLNSNKVPLTEAELIKGLIITKVGRNKQLETIRSFREIIEVRNTLGRRWDEISKWANKPEIKSFYFKEAGAGDGISKLLQLVAMCLENEKNKVDHKSPAKEYPLFNFYNKFQDFALIGQKLNDIQSILNDWHIDDHIHNLIGFCRFVKGSKYNNLEFLKTCLDCEDKSALKVHLNSTITEILPKKETIPVLKYKVDDNELHAVLLSLSVFVKGIQVRFNFHEFSEQNWSLEHIFPQSPEGKNAILNNEQKEAIRDMLGKEITKEIQTVLDKPLRTDVEKLVYYNALQEMGPLNSIGNMCLLTSGDNSSNGCGFFKEKRMNVLNLIQKGSFVPKHTFDIFSKMLPKLENHDLSLWSMSDITKHTEHILENIIINPSTIESRKI